MNKIIIKKPLALLIDYLIILLAAVAIVFTVSVILATYSGVMDGLKKPVDGLALDAIQHYIDWFGFMIFCFIYYSHAFKKYGQTIGERVMKIKIIPARDGRINLLSGVIRTLFLAPLLAVIGFIPVEKSPYRSLLDYICLTNTVKAE